MEDTQGVQGEQPKDEVSKETPLPGEQPSEDLEAKVQRLVTERLEAERRKFQSEKDKEIAKARREADEARRKAKQYEDVLQASRGVLGELEPEVAAKVRLAELEARERQYSQRDQEEQARKQWEDTYNAFTTGLSAYIKEEGIDPADKRIDWGSDTEPLITRQQKVLSSVARIHKEDVKTSELKVQDRIKELVARERKEAGLDSVDTNMGASGTVMTADRLRTMVADPAKKKELLKNVDQIFNDWKAGKLK